MFSVCLFVFCAIPTSNDRDWETGAIIANGDDVTRNTKAEAGLFPATSSQRGGTDTGSKVQAQNPRKLGHCRPTRCSHLHLQWGGCYRGFSPSPLPSWKNQPRGRAQRRSMTPRAGSTEERPLEQAHPREALAVQEEYGCADRLQHSTIFLCMLCTTGFFLVYSVWGSRQKLWIFLAKRFPLHLPF